MYIIKEVYRKVLVLYTLGSNPSSSFFRQIDRVIMETFEMLQLKSSIAQLVDEFSEKYFDKIYWEAISVDE